MKRRIGALSVFAGSGDRDVNDRDWKWIRWVVATIVIYRNIFDEPLAPLPVNLKLAVPSVDFNPGPRRSIAGSSILQAELDLWNLA